MLIETTRFGTIDIDETRVLEFPGGLLGFPTARRYALVQTTPESVFLWLQSLDAPELAFVVCDPLAFVPDYRVGIRSDDLSTLEIAEVRDSQVFVIVNKVDGFLTANLLGPLVVGVTSRKGRQVVLSDRRYGTRHRLMAAESVRAVSKTA